MSDINLKKNQELMKQYPIIKDIAWVILGGAIILLDMMDLLWVVGALFCIFGIWGAYDKLTKARGG